MRLSQFLQGFGPNKQKTSCVGVVVRRFCAGVRKRRFCAGVRKRRFCAGVRKRRFCAGVRKRRFCAGVRKRRFCVGVRKRALQRSCVKIFLDGSPKWVQLDLYLGYNSSCTHGVHFELYPNGYNSTCTLYNSNCTHGVLGYVVRKARVETRSLLTPCQFIRDFLRRLPSLSLR